MLWYIVVGLLLVAMAISDCMVRRLPLTIAVLYLAGGILPGPVIVGTPNSWTGSARGR